LNRNGNVITPVGASSDPITAGDIMFRRRWIWFGKLVSDEGFTLEYRVIRGIKAEGHSVTVYPG
jgi:hypothetical protein